MESFLKEIGLTDNEIEVFLTVSKSGRLSYGNLAKHINFNRTTMYGVARSLIKKGLLHEDIGSSKKYLVAIEPKELISPLEREQKILDHKKSLAMKAIQEFSQSPRSDKHFAPRIRFVEEDKIEQFLFAQMAKWNYSIKKYDGMWWGFQDASSVKVYTNWLSGWWKDPSSKNISSRIITNISEADRKLQRQHPDRIVKYWDNETGEFSGSMWIAGDYVITIVSKQHPYYLVETHDPVMASNLREVFKQVWKRT